MLGFDAISTLPISTLPDAGGAPSFPPGDDSDSWFSGVVRHFVAIPLAIAAAALSTSVAIAGDFHRHNDDPPRVVAFEDDSWKPQFALFATNIPSPWTDPDWVPVFRADEDYDWRAQFTPQRFTASLWSVEDDLPITAVTIVEEDGWSIAGTAIASANLAQPWGEQDWVPVFRADEDYDWKAQVGTWTIYAQPIRDDAEWVPVFRADEDYDWRAQVGTWLTFAQPLSDDGNFVRYFQADEDYEWRGQIGTWTVYPKALVDDVEWVPVFRADEDYWPQYVTALVPAWLGNAWWTDEQIVQQPGAFFPEDDYCWPLVSLPATVSTIYLPDPEQAIFAVAVEDFHDWKPQVGTATTYEQPWSVDDNFATRFNLDEDYDWRAQVGTNLVYQQPWAVDDNWVPVFRADEDYWQQFTSIPSAPRVGEAWWSDEQLVQQPLVPDEDYWWQSPILPAQALASPWFDDHALPAVTAFEDDSWRVYTPYLVAPNLALWSLDDEILPPAAIIEEEDWRVWTPAPPGTQPLYLPDPEEVPAGSLIPPVVEPPAGNDGAVWPLPKYPRRTDDEIRREQKMVEQYLAKLDERKAALEKADTVPARKRKAMLQAVKLPLLTEGMARAATDHQIQRVLQAAAADERARAIALAEFKRRYWAAVIALIALE